MLLNYEATTTTLSTENIVSNMKYQRLIDELRKKSTEIEKLVIGHPTEKRPRKREYGALIEGLKEKTAETEAYITAHTPAEGPAKRRHQEPDVPENPPEYRAPKSKYRKMINELKRKNAEAEAYQPEFIGMYTNVDQGWWT